MSITKYWLDADDKIIRTNLVWDNFAEDNEGGAGTFSDEIIGRSLFSFISGDATKMFVSTMIQRVRITNKRLDVDYRCDSPDLKRFMKMIVVPEENGVIRIENTLQKEEAFKTSIKFKLDGKNYITKRCSMCQKLNVDDKWLEADEANEYIQVEEVPIIYTVCNNCKRNLEQRVRSIKSIREHQHG